MAGPIFFAAAFAVGAAGAPAPSLRGSAQPAEGWCCVGGCDVHIACVLVEAGCDPQETHEQCCGSASWCPYPVLQSADSQRSCAFWDGLDIKDSVCPQQWQGRYAGTASCKSCWEGEDCGWTCDLTDGTKAGVDLQAYVHASHGEGYCARNPSNDPCLGWQVFGDGCSDCAASGTSSSTQASASLRTGTQNAGGNEENVTHLQSAEPQRSCAFWDGLDIKDSVCPQQWQGRYAGTASCKSCWEGEDCGWTCDLTDGTKAGIDLQAYVRASHGEGYCARNPSNDPCLGWQVFGDGCSDC